MPPFDLATGLVDLGADAPTGPNLEFDAAFGALERAATGKPEQQYGDTIIPAEEPDWKDVAAQAAALLDRTHDLRVLGHLAVARLHLSGLPDFAAGLTLIRQLLETRWEAVHPQLDPEDDNDPTLRANALLRIAHPSWVLRFLRDMPLAAAPRAGRFSWRDIGVATGAIESDPELEKPSEAQLRGAFAETPPATLAALREAAAAAAREARAIPAVFDERAGPATGPDLSDLAKLLRDIERYIQRYAVVAAPPADGAPEAPDPAADPAAGSGDSPGAGMAPDVATGFAAAGSAGRDGRAGVTALALRGIGTRAEALHLLEIVGQYYEKYEPSSPLPFLLDRARKLADKNFLEILRDLAPDGVGQAQVVVQSRDEG
jgi:type VI secretion system protein ImpA